MNISVNTIIEFLGNAQPYFVGLVIVIVIVVARFLTRLEDQMRTAHHRARALARQDEITDLDRAFYRRRQLIEVGRFSIIILLILGVIVIYRPGFLSVFAIAAGALIITFQSVLLSMGCFFYVIGHYHIGQTLIVGDETGEIVAIGLLATRIVGHDTYGQSTGQLIIVPNSKFLIGSVRIENRHHTGNRRIDMSLFYNASKYRADFSTFLESLERYLEEVIPEHDSKDLLSFRSFIGKKYQLELRQLKDSTIEIIVSFVVQSTARSHYQ